MDQIIHLAELNIAERFELETYRRQAHNKQENSEAVVVFTCQICGDENLSANAGILCPHPSEDHRHFLCDICLTSYVNSLNNDPTDSLFHKREGKIPCPGSIS